MPQRGVTIGKALACASFMALGVGVVSLVGCSGGGAGSTGTSNPTGAGVMGLAGGGGAPTSGAAGTSVSGASGSGAAGTSASGAAGDSGAAGTSTSGAAGDSGAAGTSASGAAGSGAAGTGSANGGAGGAIASGAAGSGATGTAGGRPSGPSAGCKLEAPTDALGKAVMHTMVVKVAAQYAAQYTNRKYFTTLPQGFDPTKPYPMVFWGPGCGATGSEGSSFTTGHFLTDILYVQMLSVTGCFQAGKQGTVDSPDGPYFDQMLAEVEAKYCVDTAKVFVAGTSSGAWMSNFLACERGNVVRGAAADSGGLQHDHGTCTGGAAVMEMPGDSTVIQEGGFDIGSGQTRDMFIKLNGCAMTPTTMAFGKANGCQVYGDCGSPVVWCNVGGAHQSGNQVIAESAWAFWNALK